MFSTPRKLSYQYDKNGNRTRITHPDNKYFTYDYDKLDRITQIKENGSAVLTTNVYNDRGLPDAMTRTGATTSYSYDAASRPSGSVHDLAGTYGDVTYGFGYNPASQIVSKSISNKAYITNSHYNIDRQYTTNGLNQYTGTNTGATFTYDANGNLTSDGTTTYAYDIENRLVTARGEKEANLVYDPMGRLFETNANSSLAQTTTQFLYDGDALVAEYSDAGTLLHRYVHAGGVDSPVVWYIGNTVGSGSRSHLHANWQGSITAVTDANADVQWINGYDAYGIPNWFNEGRFQYTGQIMIPELGMYHYKARVYSPTMGRFLQTDPIGYEDQVNLYLYVGNDPVGKIDPSGLSEEDVWEFLQQQIGGMGPLEALGTLAGYLKPVSDDRSEERIQTLTDETQLMARVFLNHVERQTSVVLRVVQANRTFDEQESLYAQGRTRPGQRVTGARGGQSYHNFGLAIDVHALFPDGNIDWSATQISGGQESLGTMGAIFGFEWGGSFGDNPHHANKIGHGRIDDSRLRTSWCRGNVVGCR